MFSYKVLARIDVINTSLDAHRFGLTLRLRLSPRRDKDRRRFANNRLITERNARPSVFCLIVKMVDQNTCRIIFFETMTELVDDGI